MLRRFTVVLIASATLAAGIALTPTEAIAWGWMSVYDVGYCGRPCRRPYCAYYGWGRRPYYAYYGCCPRIPPRW
jgi:hypothetical protein